MTTRDLTEEDIEFFPNYILPLTREATGDEIITAKKLFDRQLEKLLGQTKDFYEYMMLEKGVFYTRNEGSIYFHDVYGLNPKDYLSGVFLAYYTEEKGSEFQFEADVIMHLHFFSDKRLSHYMHKLNEEKNKDVGQGLTFFYFNQDEEQFRKVVLTPDSAEDERPSLVEKNNIFKLFESEIMKEDLEMIDNCMKLLLRKMKITEKSRKLA